ncbi:MAG: DUF6544 family protein [Sphaerochaeta sp.]|nr:DUF6544 family protein [Sphaerochaeta sp.]
MIKRKARIAVVTGILICCTVGIAVLFAIPYSKTREAFISLKGSLLTGSTKDLTVFTINDISRLPLPVQNYFSYCGYIGAPKMQTLEAVYKDVRFKFGKGKPAVLIDYFQINAVDNPARVAYIDSSLYGIPFEGLDSYIAGSGSMKGILARNFTLFNETGETMDMASLVTYLSECLLIPNAAIQEYIAWQEIDALHAKATISCYGRTASGIFSFNEKGEMCSFTTNDRKATSIDGKTSENVKWSVVFYKYVETNGTKKPTVFQAIWHYKDGDLLYFDGKDVSIEFDTNT